MSEDQIRVSDLMGFIETRSFQVESIGGVSQYGYSIKYDKHGIEQSRSDPSLMCITTFE